MVYQRETFGVSLLLCCITKNGSSCVFQLDNTHLAKAPLEAPGRQKSDGRMEQTGMQGR